MLLDKLIILEGDPCSQLTSPHIILQAQVHWFPCPGSLRKPESKTRLEGVKSFDLGCRVVQP